MDSRSSRRSWCKRLIACVLLALLSPVVLAAPAIRLRVDPLVGLAPLTIKVSLTVVDFPPDSGLTVYVLGDNGYQAISVMSLPPPDGHPLILPEKFFPLSEAGLYQVIADVSTGDFLSESGPVTILARTSMGVEVH